MTVKTEHQMADDPATYFAKLCDELRARVEAADAENERLRAALDAMYSWAVDAHGWRDECGDPHSLEWHGDVAQVRELLGYTNAK